MAACGPRIIGASVSEPPLHCFLLSDDKNIYTESNNGIGIGQNIQYKIKMK